MEPDVFEIIEEDLWDCDVTFYRKIAEWAKQNEHPMYET
jgi:hypothetical protein